MAAFSQRMHQAIAAYINGTQMPTPPVSLEVALCVGNPSADLSTLVEPTGGYFRQSVAFSASAGGSGGTLLTSTAPVVFGPAVGANWSTVSYGAVFDQAGNLIAFGPLGVNRTVPINDTASFGTGALQFLIE
jgi:hypothetical protein